jgi:hypothetical protein
MPDDAATELAEPRGRADLDVWGRRGCALVVAAVAAYARYEHQREYALAVPIPLVPRCGRCRWMVCCYWPRSGYSSPVNRPAVGDEWWCGCRSGCASLCRRQLKQRARGENRTVPCPPELTVLLRAHIAPVRHGHGRSGSPPESGAQTRCQSSPSPGHGRQHGQRS